MAKALVVVDMLEDFIRPHGALYVPRAERIIPAVLRELKRHRESGNLVAFVNDAHDPDDKEFIRFPPHAVEGQPGSDVIEELMPQSGEKVVEKKSFNPFYGPDLDNLLDEHGITEATVVGVCTHICVMETVSGLSHRHTKVRVPLDAIADFDEEQAQAAINRMKSVFGAEVELPED